MLHPDAPGQSISHYHPWAPGFENVATRQLKKIQQKYLNCNRTILLEPLAFQWAALALHACTAKNLPLS